MSRQQLGGPVLLKQGYMQVKTMFGWKRHYYRLLQVRACFSGSRVFFFRVFLPPLWLPDSSPALLCVCGPDGTSIFQDSLFTFSSHESKTPTDEVTLMGGRIKDASWEVKRANCVLIETESKQKVYLVCSNSQEHQQWFDALYYGTTVSTLAEYCSPLSGGWLYFMENRTWSRRWFMVGSSFFTNLSFKVSILTC